MITSTSNAKVKRLVNLKKRRKARDTEKVFLVEGIRMFQEVPKESLKELYVTEGFYKKEKQLVDGRRRESGCEFEVFADTVFQYVSDTQHPQGVLCVVRQGRESARLSDLWQKDPDGPEPLLLVLENLQDPGNMGTILRTAEAAGVTGIIMSKDCVDVFNPKVIRSTMGSVFRMPFQYVENLTETIGEMKKAGVNTYAAHLEGKSNYDDHDYHKAAAFFIGNEGNGLSDEVAQLADTYIRIPMAGRVESLNAAIAATVLMFEAGRQRRK
ncbi:MAG: 23S rRNA (guanosine(2251)-2'-O)-methyltransferase RlmB [Eubacteriales bacterium]|nr:23S rRNA (guanosine(2251)-2'-O)-methyltransferase RlmB [Eubacteriales bacterium]